MEKTRYATVDCFPYEWWQTRIDNGQYITGGPGTNSGIPDLFERITYENGYKTFNPCFHVMRSYKYAPALQVYDETATNKRTFSRRHPGLDVLEGPYSLRMPLPDRPTPAEVKDFVAEAIGIMTPSMESGFSVTNFLYELGEFTSLFKLWDRGRTFYKNLSSGALNYSFGWMPFIGDIQRLYKGLKTFDEKLRSLKEGAGRLNTRHYSRDLQLGLPAELEWVDAISGAYQNRLKRTISDRSQRVRMTCTMRYTYQLPELDRMDTRIRAFLDTIGAQLDLYTLWEALPYSFVVDWFFNVGDYLKQFRQKWIPVDLYIKAVGFSAKWVCEYSFSTKRCWQLANTNWTHLGEGVDKTFSRRKLEIDDTYFSLSAEGDLTARKFILGSLLLEQRIRR